MRIFIIAFIFVAISASPAFSDIIYFKDGGKVEGIIAEEKEDHIIIDMGFGTISVRRDEIDYIKETSPEEIERLKQKKFTHDIESGQWAPDAFEHLKDLYNRAKDSKSALQEARRKTKALRADISQKEKRVTSLLDMLDKKGRKLKSIDAKKDVRTYNDIIAEMNTLNSEINKEDKSVKALYEDEKKISTELADLADKYRNSFQHFRDTLNKNRKGLKEEEMAVDELHFFQTMAEKIKEMEGDFKKDIASYTPQGNQIIVDALLNNSTSAQLIVDTGASIVLISNDVASRLGIVYEDIQTEIDMIMADGNTAKAKPIILTSVKVGDAEIKDVQAAILDKGFIGGADGLLGMSFLNHFIIKVDNVGNRLILERVL